MTFIGWPEAKSAQRVELTRNAESLLRKLSREGDLFYGRIAKAAFHELKDLGYVVRKADNGMGKVCITKRGVLRALAEKYIDRHPFEDESRTVRLERIRRAEAGH